ncbi:MAG: endo-1,4-beta-xylanase [Bacteroidota bacterium]
MKRRKFIKNSAFMLTYLGCAPWMANGFAAQPPVVEGEEWRNINVYETHNKNLRPRDTVLKEAKQNIEKYRKGNLVLQLQNRNTSLEQLSVSVDMKEHFFDWGCSFLKEKDNFKDQERYSQFLTDFRSLFNATTAKCYWDERWHQPIEKEEGKRILDTFLEEVHTGAENGLRVKGHPAVWTIPKAIPAWMRKYDHNQRIKIWEEHVKDLVKQGGDNIHNWDVVNEMLWEPAMKNIYNRHWPHLDPIDDIADYVARSLQWVKETNPKPLRIINDYGLIKDFNDLQPVAPQRKRYLQLIEALRELNNLPDAIGCQSHVGTWYHPDEIVTAFNELAKSGLPLHVTEFWSRIDNCPVNTDHLSQEEKNQLLKQYLTDFYTVAFGHPAVQHLTYWGNPFFDAKGNKTFMYDTLYQLIRNDWTTRETKTLDENGKVTFHAFYGDYLLKIGEVKKNISFTPNDHNLEKVIVL